MFGTVPPPTGARFVWGNCIFNNTCFSNPVSGNTFVGRCAPFTAVCVAEKTCLYVERLALCRSLVDCTTKSKKVSSPKYIFLLFVQTANVFQKMGSLFGATGYGATKSNTCSNLQCLVCRVGQRAVFLKNFSTPQGIARRSQTSFLGKGLETVNSNYLKIYTLESSNKR